MHSIAPKPDPHHSPFRIDVHPERTIVRVAPAGELDIATVSLLAVQLQELRDSGFDRIVLDLRKLTFMDSTGIALLIAEDRAARDDGHDFTLISGPHAIQRVLEVCGIAGLLRFEPSRAEVTTLRVAPPPADREREIAV